MSVSIDHAALVVNGSVTNIGATPCSLSMTEVVAAMPLGENSSCGKVLLACHYGMLLYRHNMVKPTRLNCDHMALRCQNGTAVMQLRNVALCSLCTIAGGASFVDTGSVFFSAANNDGSLMEPLQQQLVTAFKYASTTQQVKPSPEQAAILQLTASVCHDPHALEDMHAIWENDRDAVLTGTLRSADGHSSVNPLGLRLRVTLDSFAHTQLGVQIWAQQPASAFSAVCFGAAIVGATGERTQLPGFCSRATNTTLKSVEDASGVELNVEFVGLKLALCPSCKLIGLGPRGALFRLSYIGSATIDKPSLVLHPPSCVFSLPKGAATAVAVEGVSSTLLAEMPSHSSTCAADGARCDASNILPGLQLLRTVPHCNASAVELLQPSASMQQARAIFVSGTLIQTAAASQCLNGMSVLVAFNRRVINGTISYIAPPDAFDITCLGMGVAGLEQNQTDINRPCTDLVTLQMTAAGGVIIFKDIQLCSNDCWLVGFGPSGSFVRIQASSGLRMDTSGMRLEAPRCPA